MVMTLIKDYTHWLHTRWPSGKPEKLPVVNDDGSTAVQGLYVVGDLTGIPLLKFSADTGARAVDTIHKQKFFENRDQNKQVAGEQVVDIAIIGGGVSGMAAALEAENRGLSYTLIEASEAFSTIVNFPKGKPIYTYPTDMTPMGDIQFTEKSDIKEGLLEELKALTKRIEPRIARVDKISRQEGALCCEIPSKGDDNQNVYAHSVIVAIGRSGNYRKLGVPGEDKQKVYNRLHDPKDFCGQKVVVVGGGDSALETAIALAECGCEVTVSYRKPEFSRPKPENVEKLTRLSTSQPSQLREESEDEHTQGRIILEMASKPKAIEDDKVTITDKDGKEQVIQNDVVFSMIGREAPLDFFRRSGVAISGEWRGKTYATFSLFMIFCFWLYLWKSDKIPAWGIEPKNLWDLIAAMNGTFQAWASDTSSFFYTLKTSASGKGFYYTLAYCLCVVIFGVRRIKKRRTPYIKYQTITLMLIQCFPLFIFPELLFPYMGHNGMFGDRYRHQLVEKADAKKLEPITALYKDGVPKEITQSKSGDELKAAKEKFLEQQSLQAKSLYKKSGFTADTSLAFKNMKVEGVLWSDSQVKLSEKGIGSIIINTKSGETYIINEQARDNWFAKAFFPPVTYGHGREYWRSYGFVLAWPLMVWNWFTEKPIWGWVILGVLQTFVLIPLMIRFWGKGSYCGWICSCGALAETMGDEHRQKMPHGPIPNKLNMIGQFFLAVCLIILFFTVVGWIFPNPVSSVIKGILTPFHIWIIDLLFAGIIGVGFYFHFSGRVWCRFACPLAALMHIYARFSQFRILVDKKKCISCNVCTSVCHQGIDIMNFANKGHHMEDPECVRCSACVQSCPTGVLTFGRYDQKNDKILGKDSLQASPVQMAELTINGASV